MNRSTPRRRTPWPPTAVRTISATATAHHSGPLAVRHRDATRTPPGMTSEVDLLVVGGGPAGVTAAIQARQLGAHRSPCSSPTRSAAPTSTGGRGRCAPWPARPDSHTTGRRGQPSGSKGLLRNLTSRQSWPTAIGLPATPSRRNIWPTSCAAKRDRPRRAPRLRPFHRSLHDHRPRRSALGGPGASSWPSEDTPDAWPSTGANWP